MTHGDLFTGIGGFMLAAKWMGWTSVFSCEIDDFCNKVTKHHFPNCIQHGDIKTTDFSIYRGRIDVLTGGFPCQPFSTAGRKLGDKDERFLFPEMLRAIREIKPAWVVAENVRGITTKKFEREYDQIQTSLVSEGYEILPVLIPATAIGADHQRDRTWIIAHSERTRQQGSWAFRTTINSAAHTDREASWPVHVFQGKSVPHLYQHDDGIPERLANLPVSDWREQSVSALGNAIVPGIAHEIFKAIEQYETIAA